MARKQFAGLVIATMMALTVACSSGPATAPPDTPAPPPVVVADTPPPRPPVTPTTTGRRLEPYPFTTPLPPPTPTILDGVYTREAPFIGTPTPCRRCAPYRAEGGVWTLTLDAGAFRVSHNGTNFQGIGSFTVSGNRLTLFNDPNCHLDVGQYTWEMDGRSLILTPVEDSCGFKLRAKNLGSGAWVKQADAAGQKLDPCQPPSQEAAITGHWPAPASCRQAHFSCRAVSEIPAAECRALVALYDSANGPAWLHNRDWLKTGQPCSWYGIRCANGHVTTITMNYNDLRGSLPPELGDLLKLQVLALYFNYLTGEIPPEIGQLADLQILILHNNRLTGSLPPELGQLANLSILDLDSNRLSGNIPPELGNLKNLRALKLINNNLSGNIPPELGNLTNLEGLFLAGNNLSGSVPPELGRLRQLTMVNLNYNRLSGSLPPNLKNLPASGYDFFDWKKERSSD